VLFPGSSANGHPAKNRAIGLCGFFFLSIFELFLRQIQFRFLKQALCCAFHTVSVVPTILLCQGTANKTLPSLVLNHQYNRLAKKTCRIQGEFLTWHNVFFIDSIV
jgi:hypothetical protein